MTDFPQTPEPARDRLATGRPATAEPAVDEPAAETAWRAFQYVTGEMTAAEESAFEAELDVEQTAREAVAAAVQLTAGIRAACSVPAPITELSPSTCQNREISEQRRRPAEQRPAEQRPAEQRPAEQRPAEQRPAEQRPAEQRPVAPASTRSASTRSASTPSASTPSASTPSASTPSAPGRSASFSRASHRIAVAAACALLAWFARQGSGPIRPAAGRDARAVELVQRWTEQHWTEQRIDADFEPSALAAWPAVSALNADEMDSDEMDSDEMDSDEMDDEAELIAAADAGDPFDDKLDEDELDEERLDDDEVVVPGWLLAAVAAEQRPDRTETSELIPEN